MLCALDDTWTDCLDEFKAYIKSTGATWRCESLPGVDKEAILSAPEVMDAKTDPGCGYGEIHSLDDLLARGEIPSAAILQGNELLDVMDILLTKELQFLQGYSLATGCLAFPYFFRMDQLQKQNPVLHLYCRAVMQCVDIVVRGVMTTGIRSDEEFMPWIRDTHTEEELKDNQIILDLEEAAKKVDRPDLASRLRWRSHFLSALKFFVHEQGKSFVMEACNMCDLAHDTINSPDFLREAEPVQDARFFRDAEVSYWSSGFSPTKTMPIYPFAEVIHAYSTMLRQLSSLRTLFDLPTIQSVLEFVEFLGAQKPLLPTRSIAVIVLFRSEPSESFLYGTSLPRRVLEDLATNHGAPLYLDIFDGKEDLLEGVVKYRVIKGMDQRKCTPDQLAFFRKQTIETVRLWALEMSKAYLIHMESMLCNRGLAHRTLMNTLPQLGSLQEMAYSTDTSVFLSLVPGTSKDFQQDIVKRMPLLTIYTNQHILHVMELIFSFTFELDFFTRGELLPALWYMNFIQNVQLDNFSAMIPPHPAAIPETRINRVTKAPLHNLVLSTRVPAGSDTVRVAILEAARLIVDAVFLSGCLMEAKGLVEFHNQSKYSLTTEERVFNNRLKCLRHIQSPSFMPYARCMAVKPNFTSVGDEPAPDLASFAQKAGKVAVGAADKLRQLITAKALNPLRAKALQDYIKAMEGTARAVGASLATFAGICNDEEVLKGYTVVVDRPFHPAMICLTLRKKAVA